MSQGTIWFVVFCLSILCTILFTVLVFLGFARRGKKEREIIENAVKNISASPASYSERMGMPEYHSGHSGCSSDSIAERIEQNAALEHAAERAMAKQPIQHPQASLQSKPEKGQTESIFGEAVASNQAQSKTAPSVQPPLQNVHVRVKFCPKCGTKTEGRFCAKCGCDLQQ